MVPSLRPGSHAGRREAVTVARDVWPRRETTPESFVERLPELAGPLQEYVRTMRFHLAPVELEDRARKRIEAAVAEHLRRQPGPVGSFQEADVRYRPRTPDEVSMRVTLTSTVVLEGLPAALEA